MAQSGTFVFRAKGHNTPAATSQRRRAKVADDADASAKAYDKKAPVKNTAEEFSYKRAPAGSAAATSSPRRSKRAQQEVSSGVSEKDAPAEPRASPSPKRAKRTSSAQSSPSRSTASSRKRTARAAGATETKRRKQETPAPSVDEPSLSSSVIRRAPDAKEVKMTEKGRRVKVAMQAALSAAGMISDNPDKVAKLMSDVGIEFVREANSLLVMIDEDEEGGEAAVVAAQKPNDRKSVQDIKLERLRNMLERLETESGDLKKIQAEYSRKSGVPASKLAFANAESDDTNMEANRASLAATRRFLERQRAASADLKADRPQQVIENALLWMDQIVPAINLMNQGRARLSARRHEMVQDIAEFGSGTNVVSDARQNIAVLAQRSPSPAKRASRRSSTASKK